MNARSRGVLFFACLSAALLCSAAVWADPPSRVGRLNLIDGSVSFRPATLDEWAPATLNYPLTTGDELWTESGARAELHLDTAVVRLASETSFSILALDDQTTQLRLSQGTLDVRLRDLPADESFEIATPQASISLLEPGSYLIDVRQDGLTDIVVRSGQADLSSGSSSITVSPNQYGALTNAAAEAFELRRAPSPDDFELWCIQRDQREDRLASGRYVPTTMIGYEDLDEYGSWQFIADYGNCWIPRVVQVGWAPYRFGHWAWVAPWGWTWIDDAPWGFAPFHYGRWVFLRGAWCWVPGVFVARPIYAPALVVFIGGTLSFGERVGWFPLGPHEVYVPPYQVSNVYIRNINIAYVTHIDVEHLDIQHVQYINHSVSGAVTVVGRQDFVRARHVGRAAVQVRADELGRAPVSGMGPSFTPERESILARPEGARQGVPRPPASTMDRPVVVRQAPPPMQYPEVRQEGPLPRQPKFRIVNPPPMQQGGGQEKGWPSEPRQIGPESRPKLKEVTPPPMQQGGGQEQGRFSEPRQVGPESRPKLKEVTPPPMQQGGGQEKGRPSEPRQVGPESRQGREGPAMVPETRDKSKLPPAPPPAKKKIRKRVLGPNGWKWIWVEEDTGDEQQYLDEGSSQH